MKIHNRIVLLYKNLIGFYLEKICIQLFCIIKLELIKIKIKTYYFYNKRKEKKQTPKCEVKFDLQILD